MSVKGTQEKAPKSVRTVEIIVGAITLVLAGLVIAFPLFAVLFIVFWLSLSLIFGGLEGSSLAQAPATFLEDGVLLA